MAGEYLLFLHLVSLPSFGVATKTALCCHIAKLSPTMCRVRKRALIAGFTRSTMQCPGIAVNAPSIRRSHEPECRHRVRQPATGDECEDGGPQGSRPGIAQARALRGRRRHLRGRPPLPGQLRQSAAARACRARMRDRMHRRLALARKIPQELQRNRHRTGYGLLSGIQHAPADLRQL